MDPNPDDPAIQLVLLGVLLVVLYYVIKTCCPSCCISEAQNDVPDHVTVEPSCTCTGLISGVVTYVSDGDGFKFLHSCPGYTHFDDTLRIRLAGIDAPEMPNTKEQTPGQPFAKEAKEFLIRLIHRKSLNLEKIRVDQYGRILAIAFLPGTDRVNVNIEMVKNGLACVYEGRDATYGGFFEQLWESQEKAKRAKKGMWSVPNVITPMEYKRQQRSQQPIIVV